MSPLPAGLSIGSCSWFSTIHFSASFVKTDIFDISSVFEKANVLSELTATEVLNIDVDIYLLVRLKLLKLDVYGACSFRRSAGQQRWAQAKCHGQISSPYRAAQAKCLCKYVCTKFIVISLTLKLGTCYNRLEVPSVSTTYKWEGSPTFSHQIGLARLEVLQATFAFAHGL